MAGDWLKMEISTPEKPEVFAITVTMGWDDPDLTVGKLFRVWRWFDQQTVDGNAPSVTPALLDRIAGVTGFALAMQKVDWLVITDKGLELPNFDKHNGKTAKSRAQGAKRAADHRSNGESNGASVTEALPREEKRREEKIETLSNPNGLEAASDAADQIIVPERRKAPRCECPHQEIISLYHEILPQCPAIRDWTPSRAVNLRARWNEEPRRQNLEYWKNFFEYVSKCDFLVGKAHSARPFMADLAWMVKSSNFVKIREGKYAND